MADFWLRWTVRLALVCYAWRLVECVWSSAGVARPDKGVVSNPDREVSFRCLATPLSGRATHSIVSRLVWILGSLLLLAHTLIAFGATHGWSPAAAYRHTAEQTRAMAGIDWGGGLYLNELTVALWLGDALWLVISPSSYARRSGWIGGALHTWLLFMVVNGAIVFAQGPTRWVSATVLGGVLIYAAVRYFPSRTQRKPV